MTVLRENKWRWSYYKCKSELLRSSKKQQVEGFISELEQCSDAEWVGRVGVPSFLLTDS